MSSYVVEEKFQKGSKRKRITANKKWTQSDEATIINYIKQNRDFEKPTSRIYYNRFLFENEMDVEWNRLRSKVRNMRITYRKAKEYEISKRGSNDFYEEDEKIRNKMLKICWYLDDFDILFPNEMETYNNGTYINNQDFTSDDESSNHESFSNVDNTSTNINEKSLPDDKSSNYESSSNFKNMNCNEKSLNEAPPMCLSSDSIKRDIFAVQTGMYNLKRQKQEETTTVKQNQQELEMFRENLNFQKEKFREEIRIKEREIESQEKVKIMELQMKERIALKELELKEKIAFRSTGKQENYENLYNDMT